MQNNPFVHLNYGNLYYFLERYEEAISSYKKVTELLDSDNRAFYNLACIYSIQNREEEAFINLEKAVERGVSYDAINGDSDFKVLRKNQDRWARLVKAHFNINTPGK
jgi:tetratricopeptide (TPR) repeat protein